MTRKNGPAVCAVAAVCFAAASSIAFAQETWDETLKNTVSYAWNTAMNTARIARLNAVTINMCWASDKNDLVRDPTVVEGFQKIRGCRGQPAGGRFLHKDPKVLNFVDLVSVAGKNWAELAPGNAEVANWGTVKGHATDCVRSASCQVVSVALAYSASGQANIRSESQVGDRYISQEKLLRKYGRPPLPTGQRSVKV